MAIWGMGDLHLSFKVNKPMDVFGAEWENHVEKIRAEWEKYVNEEDLVIIPGDISWAMYLQEAVYDLQWIGGLAGKKLLLRGNHDYWWNSISKVRQALPQSVYALQNDHFNWEGWAVCGSRGWICPGEPRFDETNDYRLYQRELHRLELSLKSAYNEGHRQIITAMHFPPFNLHKEPSDFTRLMFDYGVKICIYGHLHAEAKKNAYEGVLNGIRFIFVSADKLAFRPALLVE